MRELKFRAWDKNKKEFIDWFDMSCVGVVWTQKINCDPEYPDVVIEQYTGLKDKNGKEIYEGDIVAYSYFGEGRILKVVFYEGCFCLCETHLEIPHAGFVYYFRQGSRFRPQDDYEVIGNVHENKELLDD